MPHTSTKGKAPGAPWKSQMSLRNPIRECHNHPVQHPTTNGWTRVGSHMGGRGCQSEAVILFPDLATSKRQKAQLNHFKSSCWLYSGFPGGSDGKESACSEVLCLVTQSYKTLCDPMDCSPPVFSVRGDSPGTNTGVGCHALFQGTFPTQESNQALLHCRWILYQFSYQASLYSGHRTGKGQCSF